MDLRTETTAREITYATGKSVLYYPHIELPPPTQEPLYPGVNCQAIGIDENGQQVLKFDVSYPESPSEFQRGRLFAQLSSPEHRYTGDMDAGGPSRAFHSTQEES